MWVGRVGSVGVVFFKNRGAASGHRAWRRPFVTCRPWLLWARPCGVALAVCRLHNVFVSHQGHPYLVFELLEMDLKAFMDVTKGRGMELRLAKVGRGWSGRGGVWTLPPSPRIRPPPLPPRLVVVLSNATFVCPHLCVACVLFVLCLPPPSQRFLHQMLSGLAVCHAHRIIHRDIKPQVGWHLCAAVGVNVRMCGCVGA
jgi:hypothetical protein